MYEQVDLDLSRPSRNDSSELRRRRRAERGQSAPVEPHAPAPQFQQLRRWAWRDAKGGEQHSGWSRQGGIPCAGLDAPAEAALPEQRTRGRTPH